MEDLDIKVNLSEKSLLANDKKLKLEDSLTEADISNVPNTGEKVLKLNYLSKEGFSVHDEFNKIVKFLEEQNLLGKIKVYSNPIEEEKFYIISLIGNINAEIYRLNLL